MDEGTLFHYALRQSGRYSSAVMVSALASGTGAVLGIPTLALGNVPAAVPWLSVAITAAVFVACFEAQRRYWDRLVQESILASIDRASGMRP